MLSIALPKGSLEEQTLQLFAQADLEVKKHTRGYNPFINDPRISWVKILRPQEIPKYVAEGYFDLGIGGHDWIVESGADVIEIADMPYAKTGAGVMRLVVAVPENSPIQRPEDIKPGSRVSTELPNVTRKYFEEIGVPVKISFSYGATEAKIPELVDVVVDLTETGETLRHNRLKVIGTVLESTTRLMANKQSWSDQEKRLAIEEIKTLLLGVIEARGKVLISMNVPENKLEDIVSILPALKNPTVSKLYNSGYFAVETVVEKASVNTLIPQLKVMGAEDIIEIGISKIVR
ncbi:MAG: ATP phosphoribosyltransferase [Actinobacteria bacterium]|nr:ATP phosphoribosyltransferase [Actinomycetota bacterium]